MAVKDDIQAYIATLPEAKQADMLALHKAIQKAMPKCKLWFLDGKNEQGKVVSNPNIGYGELTMPLAGGKSREFYRIGLSANTAGISVYVMGLEDKAYLPATYGKAIGKASVTGYCIKFKAVRDIQLDVLLAAVKDGAGR